MKLLTKENVLKNKVDTIEQFKVLSYLKKQLSTPEFAVYLIDRFTIKVIDKNKEQGYFKYNSTTKEVDFYKRILKIKKERDKENKLNILMKQYKNSDGLLSEKSKMDNQLEWVKLMNNYKNIAEKIILKELIYTESV